MQPTGNSVRPWLRLIGDVHGRYEEYIRLAQQAEYSIQLGDLGFDYSLVRKELDPARHRVLGGNHDNYEEWEGRFILQPPHFLGDFGTHTVPDFGDFFFLRGGHSIDKADRQEGLDWFPLEEITYSQGMRALEMYSDLKPTLMLSHEAPTQLIDLVSGLKTWDGVPIRPSMTANLLGQMWEIHKPRLWVFGHHHRDWAMALEGTTFRCLNIMSVLDFNKTGEE